MSSSLVSDLLSFLRQSPTPFHATSNVADRLASNGFTRLRERDQWSLTRPGKYFVTRNDSSLIAFQLGTEDTSDCGLRLIGAHTDSPCLKPKPYPNINQKRYAQWGVEVYGGVLLNPWFDRDLSLAGKVSFSLKGKGIRHLLVDFKRPIAVIPSLAIHLDREANSNRSINAQTDLPPISARSEKDLGDLLKTEISQQLTDLGVTLTDEPQVLAWDLCFYDTQPPGLVGLDEEFITSARLDNLLSCFLATEALISATSGPDQWIVFNDHEEVGSTSLSGADGTFLSDVLHRVMPDEHSRLRALAQSMLISTDNAHGVHPNYAQKHDANHGPLLNEGPVIKINANQRYATSADSHAVFAQLCTEHAIPFQKFVTRSDMGCGSTIGPITAAKLGISTIDVGLPTFAMHSIRETAGAEDAQHLVHALTKFLSLPSAPISQPIAE